MEWKEFIWLTLPGDFHPVKEGNERWNSNRYCAVMLLAGSLSGSGCSGCHILPRVAYIRVDLCPFTSIINQDNVSQTWSQPTLICEICQLKKVLYLLSIMSGHVLLLTAVLCFLPFILRGYILLIFLSQLQHLLFVVKYLFVLFSFIQNKLKKKKILWGPVCTASASQRWIAFLIILTGLYLYSVCNYISDGA